MCWESLPTRRPAGTAMRWRNCRSRCENLPGRCRMSNDRQFRIEDLISSAGEVSDVAPDLKKRVLKAARKAEHRRIMRRRIQWALSGSAAAIILAAIFGIMTTPQHSETHV